MARILAAIGVVVGAFVLAGLIGELTHKPLPFVSQGAPLGTYAESTQLGLLVLGAGFALAFLAGILAFRWERPVAGIFIAAGLVEGILLAVWLSDPTRTVGTHLAHLLTGVLPPLLVAALLLIAARHPHLVRRQ